VASSCECGNKLSGSIKCGEFLGQLRTCSLLRKDSAPWSYLWVKGIYLVHVMKGIDKGLQLHPALTSILEGGKWFTFLLTVTDLPISFALSKNSLNFL
jgi:hypothetical protein